MPVTAWFESTLRSGNLKLGRARKGFRIGKVLPDRSNEYRFDGQIIAKMDGYIANQLIRQTRPSTSNIQYLLSSSEIGHIRAPLLRQPYLKRITTEIVNNSLLVRQTIVRIPPDISFDDGRPRFGDCNIPTDTTNRQKQHRRTPGQLHCFLPEWKIQFGKSPLCFRMHRLWLCGLACVGR